LVQPTFSVLVPSIGGENQQPKNSLFLFQTFSRSYPPGKKKEKKTSSRKRCFDGADAKRKRRFSSFHGIFIRSEEFLKAQKKRHAQLCR